MITQILKDMGEFSRNPDIFFFYVMRVPDLSLDCQDNIHFKEASSSNTAIFNNHIYLAASELDKEATPPPLLKLFILEILVDFNN